jgi:hypothetical protein
MPVVNRNLNHYLHPAFALGVAQLEVQVVPPPVIAQKCGTHKPAARARAKGKEARAAPSRISDFGWSVSTCHASYDCLLSTLSTLLAQLVQAAVDVQHACGDRPRQVFLRQLQGPEVGVTASKFRRISVYQSRKARRPVRPEALRKPHRRFQALRTFIYQKFGPRRQEVVVIRSVLRPGERVGHPEGELRDSRQGQPGALEKVVKFQVKPLALAA